MSRRMLGGGRVLGSGKNISALKQSNPRAVSPSASSISLNSQTSASQFSSETQDLTSRISVENGEASTSTAPTASSTHLACPICNEEMVTLLQLNRHLDDVHQNLEEIKQDEVKVWFKAQMDKAKRFQPLAVLNQKLKGLDVFESNENNQPSVASRQPVSQQAPPELPKPSDPDETISRDHWQIRGPYDVCLEPTCGKRLSVTNGCVNCRKCGKLFCEEHTMYQMRLSRSAQHEPIRGLWYRVCETCYKSREGYNGHGHTRDHTEEFKSLRKRTVDKALLEVSRLEKRLTRLTQLLATLPADQIQSGTNKRWSIAWQSDQRRALEQSVVGWQDDTSVSKCPNCQQDFTSYTFRRHHCRTCGRVVCGDLETACSTEVGLTILSKAESSLEKSVANRISVDVRLCKDCKATLFDRRDFEEDRMRRPPDVRAYENLVQFERGIKLLQPKFQRLLAALQDPRKPPSASQLSEASKVRRRLIDSFAQYDTAARRIRDLPTQSPTQARLQKAIYQQASNFLHLYMLPLKSLPKILKHAASKGLTLNGRVPNGGDMQTAGHTNGSAVARGHPLASDPTSIGSESNTTNDSNVSISSDNSSVVSALEAEEKSLRERLIVLEEQKFFVSEMIVDANRRRKFDEVSSLALNIEDLSNEIDRTKDMLSQLDFEGVYTSNPRP